MTPKHHGSYTTGVVLGSFCGIPESRPLFVFDEVEGLLGVVEMGPLGIFCLFTFYSPVSNFPKIIGRHSGPSHQIGDPLTGPPRLARSAGFSRVGTCRHCISAWMFSNLSHSFLHKLIVFPISANPVQYNHAVQPAVNRLLRKTLFTTRFVAA